MKKILALFILTLTILAFSPKTYAIYSAEENILEHFTWSIKIGVGNRYYMESNTVMIEYDYLYLTLNTIMTEGETFDAVEMIQPGNYSTVSIRLLEGQSTPDYQKYFDYEEPESDIMILTDKDSPLETSTGPFNLGTYKGMFMSIRLEFIRTLNAQQRGTFVYLLNSDDADVVVDWVFLSYNDIQAETTLLDLPETVGSPFDEDMIDDVDYSKYGSVEFNYINGDVSLWITYFGVYTYTIPDVTFEDDFLTGVEEVYYYTEDGDRYLYFSYGEYDDFLLTDGSALAKPWSAFSIWNLTTNEVVTTQRVWSLTYIEVIDLEAYAYFYMPNVPMDDLLSVSLTYKHRVGKSGPTTLWQQKYTDWKTSAIVLEKDAESLEAYPQWVYDTWVSGGVAVVAGGVLTAFGGGIVGIPVALVGGILLNVANVGAVVELFTDNIDQITQINYPNGALVTAINSHYTELAGYSIDVSGQTVYKLHIGSFTGVDVNYVEFDTSNYKYTEIVWTTNGAVYSANDDQIITEVIVDEDYVAERPEESDLNIMGFIMLPMITILFIVLAFRLKAFSDIKQLLIIVAVYVVILLIVGAI